MKQILRPPFAGMQLLGGMGFRRLAVLLPFPPGLSVDDDRYERFFGHRTSVSQRYEWFMLFNRIMAELATGAGLHFIDLRESTTQSGLLDPQYYLDGFHLNLKAAVLAIRAVVAACALCCDG